MPVHDPPLSLWGHLLQVTNGLISSLVHVPMSYEMNKKKLLPLNAPCCPVSRVTDSESLAEDALADIQGTIPRHQANQNLSDRIGTKMLDKFEEVMRNRPDKKPWKVLAGKSPN